MMMKGKEPIVNTRKIVLSLLSSMLLAAAAPAAQAHDHYRDRGHYHGPRTSFGFYMGVPFGNPWYVPPPSYYYSAPQTVIIRAPEPPPVYIERQAPVAAPSAPPMWYYCNNPQGYYPYVRQCPSGWLQVAPTPPPN